MVDKNKPGGRDPIYEVCVKAVVVEVWLKQRQNRAYFDLTLSQRYTFEEYDELREFIQLRYANAAIEALARAVSWIHDHKEEYYKDLGPDNS